MKKRHMNMRDRNFYIEFSILYRRDGIGLNCNELD